MTSSRDLVVAADLPCHEAVRLLAVSTVSSRAQVLAGFDVGPEATVGYLKLVEERRSGAPLQYLEGSVSFGPVELSVDARALVPRPETEYLWSLLTGLLGDPQRILDIGTGTGALALGLKTSFPSATVIATEISDEAATLACHNAAEAGLEIDVRIGDLFSPVRSAMIGSFDLVVSNPPYIAEADWALLPEDVRDHEPLVALVGGETGSEVITRLVSEAFQWLRAGGLLAVEIGETQGTELLAMAGDYADARIERDLAGRDRYLFARRPGG